MTEGIVTEFLLTYGWAILVILACVGALAYFGVLSPDNLFPVKPIDKECCQKICKELGQDKGIEFQCQNIVDAEAYCVSNQTDKSWKENVLVRQAYLIGITNKSVCDS